MDYSMLLAVHNIDQAARDRVSFSDYFDRPSLQLTGLSRLLTLCVTNSMLYRLNSASVCMLTSFSAPVHCHCGYCYH